MRVGVAGITGRMGRLVAEELDAAGEVFAGGVSRNTGDIQDIARASDVMIDFTHPETVRSHAQAVAGSRCAWVLGTTGVSAGDEAWVASAAEQVPVVWAANFSPGVTLLLHLARRLARALPAAEYDAEIIEMHHRHKHDAPSGTALALGRAVASGRDTPFDAVAVRGRDGQTGPRQAGTVGFAALRGGEVVGEHTLLFAGADDHISVTHKALDRRIFARGAVRAALWTRGRAPGLYTMADVIGLPNED